MIMFVGTLFHYEGIGLKDRYFLDPQWLCDQLAQVQTVFALSPACLAEKQQIPIL
jgi:hypothetical protein